MRPSTRAELLRAWTAWDTQPGAVATAHTMEDACQAAARELGCGCAHLRDLLSSARRAGLSRPAAIDHAQTTILGGRSQRNGT
jgi:hypothetical protein